MQWHAMQWNDHEMTSNEMMQNDMRMRYKRQTLDEGFEVLGPLAEDKELNISVRGWELMNWNCSQNRDWISDWQGVKFWIWAKFGLWIVMGQMDQLTGSLKDF